MRPGFSGMIMIMIELMPRPMWTGMESWIMGSL